MTKTPLPSVEIEPAWAAMFGFDERLKHRLDADAVRYLKEGQWIPGRKSIYVEAPGETVNLD